MGQRSAVKQLLILIVTVASASGAITRTQAVSANATSAVLSSTTANDAIIVFSYNSGANTAPTLSAGFTNLGTTTGNTQGVRIAWKFSSGGETTTGTWTNATQVVCHVYRGTDLTTPFTLNGNLFSGSANTTTMNFPAMTLTRTDGTSWIAGFGAAKAATAGMNGNTASMTSRTNVTTACGLDTGAGKTSWSTETFTFTTSSARLSIPVEVMAPTGITAQQKASFFQFFK